MPPHPAFARIDDMKDLTKLKFRLQHGLKDDQSGVSIVEFALILPLFLGLGTMGVEIANMASAKMQISQIATSVADNASRLGQTDNSAAVLPINETDVDAVMFGALQQGAGLDFENNGRIVLSSLEQDPRKRQFIRWQRCAGDLDRESLYGDEKNNNGLGGKRITGMGPSGREITAGANQAVMFVEVYYTYQPIFGSMLTDGVEFRQEAAMLVRDDRDLDGGGDGLAGTATSTCD